MLKLCQWPLPALLLFFAAACTSTQEAAPPPPQATRAVDTAAAGTTVAGTTVAGTTALATTPTAKGPAAAALASPEKPETHAALSRLGKRAEGTEGMVTAAHPLAVQAGTVVMEAGGNAIDAAVATAFVLEVVEPMMSGIGGGGAMMIWRQEAQRADFLEFYAQAGEDPDYGLEEIPASERSRERMVAVPGTVAGLLSAHERYGALPRRAVMAPAIRAAREGFLVHPLLARVVREEEEKLTADSAAAAIFFPEGEAIQAGERLERPRLARTFERVAEEGPAGFYEGALAEAVVGRLQEGGSPLTLQDFAQYEPNWRRPLCGAYKGHAVLAATPPLDGVEVLEVLELLEPYDLPALGLPAESPEALGPLVDAIRIARADRAAWVGDPDDTAVPAVGLASAAFAEERRALIGATLVPDTLEAGDPWDEEQSATAPAACARLDPYAATTLPRPAAAAEDSSRAAGGESDEQEETQQDETQTTHLSVVDRAGNAVSLTYTMGLYFGSGVWAEGAFFNSAALNFGDAPANARAPRRTPRSTTTPTIVLSSTGGNGGGSNASGGNADGSRVRLVVGSPGSGRIPPAIVQMILYTLDYGLDPAAAVRMPRVYPYVESETVRVEQRFAAEALAGLNERGYEIDVNGPFDLYFGGVHMVLVEEEGRMIGVADPRRNGAARAAGDAAAPADAAQGQ